MLLVECLAHYLANGMHAKNESSYYYYYCCSISTSSLNFNNIPETILFSNQTRLFTILNSHLYIHAFPQPGEKLSLFQVVRS